MDAWRTGLVLVFAILFCVLLTNGSAGRQKAGRLSSDSQILSSLDIDEVTAEQLWIYCRIDLMKIKETLKNSDIFLHEDVASDSTEINLKARSITKHSLQKEISSLPPQMKHDLLDCLSKQNFPIPVSGEEGGSRNWYDVYLEALFGWQPTTRRHLADQSVQSIEPAPAPAPVPAAGPSPASTPIPTPSPISASAAEPPSYSPVPSPDTAPSSSQAPFPVEAPEQLFYPTDPHRSRMQPSDDEYSMASPEISPFLPSEKYSSNNTHVVAVAVVVTAAGTFLFAAFLFYCYHRCHKNNSLGDGQKDEKPLLTLSMSDFSVGSSQKSFALGNSINKEKLRTSSFKTNPSLDGKGSYLEFNSIPIDSDSAKFSLAEPPSSGALSGEPSVVSSNTPVPLPLPPGMKSSPIRATLPTSGPPPPPGLPPPPSPPPPPPIPTGIKSGPRPPAPPKGVFPPHSPQINSSSKMTPPSPLGPNNPGKIPSGQQSGAKVGAEAPKTKLKPFFWDKVLASPDHSMVWHQISSGSFQFNEEMIESLFGYNSADKTKNERRKEASSHDPSNQYIQILDPKKSQNLAILLKALNVTIEEVCDALLEGNEIPTELLQMLLKMAPTTEEELKLRLYSGEMSQLGPAERFLKTLVDIPFAFKRMDALLFMCSLQEEVSGIKESFATLEVACKELRSSRLFLKLLEAVLKTGNRMNDGTFRGGAQAFKLDTLLKLADVKGTDGKTTLLHFVVQEIIRSEGMRAVRASRESGSISSINSVDFVDNSPHETRDHYCSLGLHVVSGLSGELKNVKKAAVLDADDLKGTVANFGHGLVKAKEFLNSKMRSVEEESGFHRALKSFVGHAEIDVTWLLEEEKRIRSLVKSTTDYFHGNASKDEGLRLFVIVRDFLGIVDKACKEVRESTKKVPKTPKNSEAPAVPLPDPRQLLFPTIRERRMDSSSSDEESQSP
ncbi:formin-like protein 3 [Tasmannia lanceolata]|uniref:formin-like protein 3 n=1 Tax=Tasmannia lanceolata TaxID=3420 RepID=UPI00406415E6